MREFEEYKRNQERVDNCLVHKFDAPEPPYAHNMELTCQNCGGWLKVNDILRYCQGYVAAGGDAGKIFPGF